MNSKKSRAIIALLLLFLVSGCISPIPDSIKHCFKSGNWFNDNISIITLNSNWDFQCVEGVAIHEKNPKLCNFLHTSVDSICLQDYCAEINDATVCNLDTHLPKTSSE